MFFVNLIVGLLATIGHHVSGLACLIFCGVFGSDFLLLHLSQCDHVNFSGHGGGDRRFFYYLRFSFVCGPKNLVSLFPLSSSSSLLASFFFYRFICASWTLSTAMTGNLFSLWVSMSEFWGYERDL
ncbi:hypothetical protein DFP73DRAFT_566126 [Morchella snyderi]|nr:hypothetical protein DFP73DRAFT_566126 [Morchella snyderi]